MTNEKRSHQLCSDRRGQQATTGRQKPVFAHPDVGMISKSSREGSFRYDTSTLRWLGGEDANLPSLRHNPPLPETNCHDHTFSSVLYRKGRVMKTNRPLRTCHPFSNLNFWFQISSSVRRHFYYYLKSVLPPPLLLGNGIAFRVRRRAWYVFLLVFIMTRYYALWSSRTYP